MKVCQNCGEVIPDTAKFCRNCGTPAPVEVAAPIDQVRPAEAPTEVLVNAEPAGDAGFEYQDPYQQQKQQHEQRQQQQQQKQQEQRQQQHAPYSSAGTDYAPASQWDHTGEYDPQDISENKVVAMLIYLLGTLGIIIALLKSSTSAYAEFHVRQGLKFVALNCLIVSASVVLVPLLMFSMGLAAGGMIDSYNDGNALGFGGAGVFGGFFLILFILLSVFSFILFIIKIICFVSICKGKAVEPPLVRSIGFMR